MILDALFALPLIVKLVVALLVLLVIYNTYQAFAVADYKSKSRRF